MKFGRIGIAAQALGIAEAALEEAVTYARTRRQFGKTIAEQQGVGFKLADMATSTEVAKLLVYRAAYFKTKGLFLCKRSLDCQTISSKTAMEVTTEAIQIFGGYGYTEDYPVERFFRDAKITEIYEGTK